MAPRPHPSISNRPLSQILKRFYSAPSDGQIPAAKQKYVPTSGTYPQGFTLGTAHVGIKASNTKHDDLVLIRSDRNANAAGTFTKNIFQAAPVTVSKQRLRNGQEYAKGVIINSGCANAVTGKAGIEDAKRMCEAADAVFGKDLKADGTPRGGGALVMSTGVIGQRLPVQKIVDKVPAAAETFGDSHDHWLRAARAICTTDTFPKLASREFTLPKIEGTFRMAGMAKGAGMIHPNMGTLLGVVCTDAPINSQDQTTMLRRAVNKSFNRISIDGDTSTNDTLLVLANGAAKQDEIVPGYTNAPEACQAYENELTALCTDLAKLVVRDGEGATKFVTIRVRGAKSEVVGQQLAQSIATSSLVKTALYGQDANWGRILCALGYAHLNNEKLQPKTVNPAKTSVSFVQVADREGGLNKGEELNLLINGEPQDVDEEKAAKMLKEEDLEILVRLVPDEESTANDLTEVEYWTCDFSHEYVTINGDYRT